MPQSLHYSYANKCTGLRNEDDDACVATPVWLEESTTKIRVTKLPQRNDTPATRQSPSTEEGVLSQGSRKGGFVAGLW